MQQYQGRTSNAGQHQRQVPSSSLLATASSMTASVNQMNLILPTSAGIPSLSEQHQNRQWSTANNAPANVFAGVGPQFHLMQPAAASHATNQAQDFVQQLSPKQQQQPQQDASNLASLLQLLSALQMPQDGQASSPSLHELSGAGSSTSEGDDLLSVSHGSETPTLPGLPGLNDFAAGINDFAALNQSPMSGLNEFAAGGQDAMLQLCLQRQLAQRTQQLQIEQQLRLQQALQQEQVLLAHQLRLQQAAAALRAEGSTAPGARLPGSLLNMLAGLEGDRPDGGIARERKRVGGTTHCHHKLFKVGHLCRYA